MFDLINEALQSAADVLAPPPTNLQNFEYHWKHVKHFYTMNAADMPKVHINNTKIPIHLTEMLNVLIEEEQQQQQNVLSNGTVATSTSVPSPIPLTRLNNDECFSFILSNRPFDLLTDICVTDKPPGATVCILNWMRRFLSCLENPRLEHKSIFQPIQKLITYCRGTAGSAFSYEEEEIVFLLTVAGVVRKDPILLNLFLPSHVFSLANTSMQLKPKTKNTLFETKYWHHCLPSIQIAVQ